MLKTDELDTSANIVVNNSRHISRKIEIPTQQTISNEDLSYQSPVPRPMTAYVTRTKSAHGDTESIFSDASTASNLTDVLDNLKKYF